MTTLIYIFLVLLLIGLTIKKPVLGIGLFLLIYWLGRKGKKSVAHSKVKDKEEKTPKQERPQKVLKTYNQPVITLSDPVKFVVVKVEHIGNGTFSIGIAERITEKTGNVRLSGIQFTTKTAIGTTQTSFGNKLKVFYSWS